MLALYLVGTDTAVGKTTVACALLRQAAVEGVRAVPFKPAQTGSDSPSDAERLLASAGLPPNAAATISPHTWPEPLAPGIAEDPAPFLAGAPEPVICPALEHAAATLDRLRAEHDPDLVIVEGAGGLHVPMPGGTWQPRWITRLATHTLVVGRAGLGTIHHTLAVIDELRRLGRPPLGFVLSQSGTTTDPSAETNAAVIAARSRVDHLATFPRDAAGRAIAASTTLERVRLLLPEATR